MPQKKENWSYKIKLIVYSPDPMRNQIAIPYHVSVTGKHKREAINKALAKIKKKFNSHFPAHTIENIVVESIDCTAKISSRTMKPKTKMPRTLMLPFDKYPEIVHLEDEVRDVGETKVIWKKILFNNLIVYLLENDKVSLDETRKRLIITNNTQRQVKILAWNNAGAPVFTLWRLEKGQLKKPDIFPINDNTRCYWLDKKEYKEVKKIAKEKLKRYFKEGGEHNEK